MKRCMSIFAALLTASGTLFAQSVIDSYDDNSNLSWSRVAKGTTSTVEWAASMGAAGDTNWYALKSVIATGFNQVASVPRFYRVVGTPQPPNATIIVSATTNCFINGLEGLDTPCTNVFNNYEPGIAGTYTVTVTLNSLNIGGSTTNLFLVTNRQGDSGLAYFVLTPGANTVPSGGGEFSLFFVDKDTLADNSGSATVAFTGPASSTIVVDAQTNCLVAGFNGDTNTCGTFNNAIVTATNYAIEVQLNGLNIGGNTRQVMMTANREGTSGIAYFVLNPGMNYVGNIGDEFSFFFSDKANLGDNAGSATVTLYEKY